jgi:eukaryotic-like serine/threonine-protein kinase
MELRGEGPGTAEFAALSAQRDALARAGRRAVLRLGREAAATLAGEVRAAPRTAFGVLLSPPGDRSATHVQALRDRDGGTGPDGLGPQQWPALVREFARRGLEPLAFYVARRGRRPAPADTRLAERLGLPGVYASAEDDGTVHLEGYAFGAGEPAAARVVVDPGEQPSAPAAGERKSPARHESGSGGSVDAGRRMPFNARAVAIGTWRDVHRALPARAADDPAAFGPYEVLELVGEGGFGRIHLCQDADGILVAVKTLHEEYAADPELRAAFAHEVQAAQRVEGRFTVPVVAADTGGATPWMAVPYVAAPSLKELAARTGPLDEASVRAVGAGIATALTAIHAQGIVHLDLKPANVLMTEDGPRVIDFGIAQIERLTAPREGFAGTYLYASPEQLREEARFTPAGDVFSLGTVLAELALGRSPWGDGEVIERIVRICSGEPDLAGMPDGLAAVVRRCLHTDPAGRPSPAEVARALMPGAPVTGPAAAPPLPARARDLIRGHATRDTRTTPLTGTTPLIRANPGTPATPATPAASAAQATGPVTPATVAPRTPVGPAVTTAVATAPATARGALRRIARDLGVRLQRWERTAAVRGRARGGVVRLARSATAWPVPLSPRRRSPPRRRVAAGPPPRAPAQGRSAGSAGRSATRRARCSAPATR